MLGRNLHLIMNRAVMRLCEEHSESNYLSNISNYMTLVSNYISNYMTLVPLSNTITT